MSQQDPPPSYPVQPEKPWRTNWSEPEKQNLLRTLNSFQLATSEVNSLRILLHGPIGAGRSSFINSVDSSLQGRITTRAPAESLHGPVWTLECKAYKMRKERPGSYLPFTLIDIMGFEPRGGIQTDDIIKILHGHIKDGYKFNPICPISEEDPKLKRNPSLKDKIHCLVGVISATHFKVLDEDVIIQMREVQRKAQDFGIPQVLIMTMVDTACPLVQEDLEKLCTSKAIKEKMEECSVRLGVPVDCIFPVMNYHEENTTNIKMDVLILNALKNIVNFANDYVEDQVE